MAVKSFKLPEKKKEEPLTKKIEKFLNIYILPVGAIVLFFGIVIFLVIPKISKIFSKIEEIRTLNSEYDLKESELVAVKNLENEKTTILGNLTKINELAPSGQTKVVEYGNKIAELTKTHNLTITNQRLSDSRLENASNNESALVLREVPNLFELQGELLDIKQFVQDISQLSDFVVVEEIEMSQVNSEESSLWLLSLTLIKYQFTVQRPELVDQLFLAVPPQSRIDDEVLKYL